jgi:glutamate dehydrogenase
VWLHDLHFGWQVQPVAGWEARFTQALLECLDHRVETDALLQLVMSAPLSGRDVAVLRTYSSYIAQWLPFGVSTVHAALIANSSVAQAIMELFNARFGGGDEPRAAAAQAELVGLLDSVASLEHDRVLRALLATVNATVRTNAFRKDEAGLPVQTISLKLATAEISMLPLPHPYAEIWLDGPIVHGVHLRFGSVARGGLRWSDRRDDLRTEIMGLVRAQVVKNAVIVPTGAKGGFFAKQLPDSSQREAWMAAGIAAYQVFINALLDVTDNLVDGQIEKPTDVICRDGDDPYLVVAADKGTATFSDIANAVAISRGFWLQDAFASGGSVGYDHKAMGITARGAWESVVHHGRLLGIDVQSDPATIVGIGDMSGDVFGNGLLRSKSVRLIAAFDHRHIFIDPQPRVAEAFAERQRLFDLPRSAWSDFNSELISNGGGIYARTDKRIELSPQAKAALAIDSDIEFLTPAELITWILKAPVDILWNGGIGTYVKSAGESHADVGDRANDPIRINGNELRCKIVGEGGNLGFTQRGRIEASLAGVRMNTDAIDNSAGVDTSDHEVNLKILLSQRVTLGYEERNELLRSMTDDVAHLVLEDNILQNEVLSFAHAQAHSMITVHSRLIETWNEQGILHRHLEALPTPQELEIRAAAGLGLTRPELSVLLAHAKILLTHELLAGSAIDGDWALPWLMSYFPSALHADWREEIAQHPLRREIIATVLANRIVNLSGITAVYRLTEESGLDAESAALALLSAMEISGLDTLKSQLSADSVTWPARIAVSLEARRYVDRIARWLLAHRANAEQLVSDLDRLREVAHAVRRLIATHLKGGELQRWQQSATSFESLGMPRDLAATFAGLLDEYAALDLADRPASEAVPTEIWSQVYFEISEIVGGDAILNAISALPRQDRWQTMARAAMRADMYAVLATLASAVLEMSEADRVGQWQATHAVGIGRVRAVVTEISSAPVSDLAAISVALRMLRELVAQSS